MYMRVGGRSSEELVHIDSNYYVPEALESRCSEKYHQSVQSPESSSEGKGVHTKILLLVSEVAEVGHFACKHGKQQ